VKFGVVVFPGSNCDRDVAYVTRDLLNQPTRMVWHEETDISDLMWWLFLVASAMGIIYVVVRSLVFLL